MKKIQDKIQGLAIILVAVVLSFFYLTASNIDIGTVKWNFKTPLIEFGAEVDKQQPVQKLLPQVSKLDVNKKFSIKNVATNRFDAH